MNTSTINRVVLSDEIASTVAHELLAISAVQLNVDQPFTWVSGIKSPIYCDNRKINSHVTSRNKVVDAFVELITTHFSNVETVAGVATGGIPMGVLIADRLKLPFIYVRQVPKEHGLKKQVEGDYEPGAKVILIEDLISTGGSSMKAVSGIKNDGLHLLALISIMTYNFKEALDLFPNNDVKHVSLTDLDALLNQALKEERLTKEQADRVLVFRENPARW